MNGYRLSLVLASTALVASCLAAPGLAAVFTYQGRLDEDGTPKAGTVDLRFDAFAFDSSGAPLNAVPVIRDGVPLIDGVFTVEVDFGVSVFTGAPVFVQVGVREDVAGNAATLTGFTNLVPRQAVTATPYAQHAANVGTDAVSSVQIANGSITASDANTTSSSDGLQRRVSGSCAINSAVRVLNADGTVVCETDDVGAGAAAWGLSGNSGTDPGTNFIGTTDFRPLELRSDGQRVARLQSIPITIANTANVLLGSLVNFTEPSIRGATIGGGGAASGDSDPNFVGEGPNRIGDHYGTVGGGMANTAGDALGTLTDRPFATVAGGQGNLASGAHSTVGGGSTNVASAATSTVGGGSGNRATGGEGTVGGGGDNDASGSRSTVGGGVDNTAAAENSTVGGGLSNNALGANSTASGGSSNAAVGLDSTVSGGFGNTAFGDASTVGGGNRNCAGDKNTWAGGNRAKVRLPMDTGSNPAGNGCDNLPNNTDLKGDRGTFVWADNQAGDFVSQGSNQFLLRVASGVGIQPGNGTVQELANVPEALLHVFKGSAGAAATADQNSVAVFESNTSAFISLLAPVSGSRGVLFGEDGDNTDGSIIYNPDNSLHLRANGDVTRLAIEGDGDVGIGTETAAVTNRLHVTKQSSGTTPGSHVVLLENTEAAQASVLALKVGAATVGAGLNFVTFFNASNTPIGSIEGNGTTGVVYSTSGADYAEWLPRMDAIEVIAPGELVGLHAGGKVSKRIEGAIRILIASTGAAVAGNSPGESAEATHTLIAFVGQVQARVCGEVHAGDAILAAEDDSGCGVARDPKQLTAHEFARVAGIAWESATGEGGHRVRVAVGLGEGGTERAAMLARIDALEAKLSTQQALVDALLARQTGVVAAAE